MSGYVYNDYQSQMQVNKSTKWLLNLRLRIFLCKVKIIFVSHSLSMEERRLAEKKTTTKILRSESKFSSKAR